jgi:endonuclease/exonuclease/phosphatase family metal-dependent hydrolase
MTYNLLKYQYDTPSIERHPHYRKIIQYSDPDVLVVQEISNWYYGRAGQEFLAGVLNYQTPNLYAAGDFIDGYDTDNALFYKPSKVTYIGATAFKTALRDITRFLIKDNITGDTLQIFSVHLKAGSTYDDMVKRGAEVDVMRTVTNSYPIASNFIAVGDFNLYISSETAYQKLLKQNPTDDGNFYDPVTMPYPYDWGNYANRYYHTQSSRIRSFGGGATGGMNSRFDLHLHSRAVTEKGGIDYIPGSLTAVGNDGNHWKDSVNRPINTTVPEDVAQALHDASDHLPVYALYAFGIPTSVGREEVMPQDFKLFQNYPNPFNPKTAISYLLIANSFVEIELFDVLGREVVTLVQGIQSAGVHSIIWDASKNTGGIYFCKLKVGSKVKTIKIVLAR